MPASTPRALPIARLRPPPPSLALPERGRADRVLLRSVQSTSTPQLLVGPWRGAPYDSDSSARFRGAPLSPPGVIAPRWPQRTLR